MEGSFTSINHSLLIHPFIPRNKVVQAGWGVANNVVDARREVRDRRITVSVDVSCVNTGYR